MTVAATILEQLGGNRFVYMTGAKHLVSDANMLQFRIGRNGSKANEVVIRLNGRDLYDVEFWAIRGMKFTKLDTKENVYAEDLRRVFTGYTGLVTSL